MTRINKKVMSFLGTFLLASSLVLVGCSSSPSEEELRQLNELKDQAASLQRDVTSKQAQKSALEKEVADKNAKIKKCNDDQLVVKQRLAK